MIRLLICVLAVPALVYLATAAPVPKHLMPKEGSVYFPTKVGAKWVWQDGESEYTEVITEVENQPGGSKLVSVGHINPNGEVISARSVVVSDRGLFQLSQGGHVIGTSYCLLKLPHHAGDEWKNVKPTFWDRACTVSEHEWVEVPAGRFWAVRVESKEFRIPGKLHTTTVWYAPEVGHVKWSSSIDGAAPENTTVLKSFTLSNE